MEGDSDQCESLEEPIPQVKWAQRPNLIFLTICLEDCKSPKIELLPGRLIFQGVSGPENKQYKLNIEFLKEIVPEKCKFAIRDREIDLVLEKLESGPYWDRLIKSKTKTHWLKVNFDKWVDEEELNEKNPDSSAPNFDNMNWNSLMELIKRNSPPGDNENPVEKIAKTNESMKSMVSKYQENQQLKN